jgi:dTDP-glucose 4,6-dehydratase
VRRSLKLDTPVFIIETRPEMSVINLDALTYSGNPENLADIADHDRYRFVHGSVNDAALLDELIPEVDVVMHLAAESHVDRSIMDATPFMVTNALGTQTLLDATRAAIADSKKPIRFLYVSTDEVYGTLPLEDTSLKFTEETPLQPNSPYAASKTAGDLIARAYHHTHGMDIVTTRCSNNFGPYQFPEKVIPLFVNNLLDGETVPLYGDGKNVRDWLHVLDHCEAMLAVLDKGKPGEAYNVGGNNERSNLELTHALLDLCGRDQDAIVYVQDRPGHDLRYAIDASKIEREVGWVPSRSAWPDALESTVTWYRENRGWSDRIRSGAYREFYETLYGQRGAATPG